jgi:hypothetical protein
MPSAVFTNLAALAASHYIDVFLLPDHAHVRVGGPFRAPPPVDPRLLMTPRPQEVVLVIAGD